MLPCLAFPAVEYDLRIHPFFNSLARCPVGSVKLRKALFDERCYRFEFAPVEMVGMALGVKLKIGVALVCVENVAVHESVFLGGFMVTESCV